jgi:hypothetical protein
VPSITPFPHTPGTLVVVVLDSVVVEVEAVPGVDDVEDVDDVVVEELLGVSAGQWQASSQRPPAAHAAPGGSHCSPLAALTLSSPQRAAQSLPSARQQLRQPATNVAHAALSGRTVTLAWWRHCRIAAWPPLHSARSASSFVFTCRPQSFFAWPHAWMQARTAGEAAGAGPRRSRNATRIVHRRAPADTARVCSTGAKQGAKAVHDSVAGSHIWMRAPRMADARAPLSAAP